MCRSFDGEAEPTLRATLQLAITGRGGGRWHLRIDRGQCDSGHGDAQRPDLVVRATVQEFVRLGLGQVTPFWSAAKGTLGVSGRTRLGEALRVLSLFKASYRWPDP